MKTNNKSRKTRAIASGRASGARPPIQSLCPLILCLAPGLLHASNNVFKNVLPLVAFGTPCCEILPTGLWKTLNLCVRE